MEWKEYEEKARDWAQKKYNCEFTKKTYTLTFDGRKLSPDFSSTDNSKLGDAKSGSSYDKGEFRTIGYTVLKMMLVEKALKRKKPCMKFLVFKNKEQAVEFRENMEGGLVLALLFKDSFEIWYWNDQTDEEEKLYPMS